MFNIGDTVYVPKYGNLKKYITCPHCLGNRYLVCILGDGTQVTFDCECCRVGLENPGKMAIYEWDAAVDSVVLSGIEIREDNGKQKTRYMYGCWSFDDAFATYDEALAFAKIKVIEHAKDEQKRIEQRKETATKSWAWNVTYHRDRVKSCEKDLAYHKQRLNVAQENAAIQEARKK
jgi:ribosomal protein L24